MYNLGQLVRVTTTVRDPAGVVVTNATVTPAVTAPDGTVSVPTVTNHADGTYSIDVNANQSGFWLYVFTATGTAAGVDQGQFAVRPIGPRIISLAEAKRHLDKMQAKTADDEEIGDMIDMATVLLEPLAGIMVPRSVTEIHNGPPGNLSIFLRHWPILSMTSIVEKYSDGTTYTLIASDFIFDVRSRQLTRVSAGYVPYPWPIGLVNITITAQAGRNPIPQNFRTAAAELVGNLWRTTQQRSAGQRPGVPGQGVDIVPVTYAIPRRVQEMLYGGRRAPMLGRSDGNGTWMSGSRMGW